MIRVLKILLLTISVMLFQSCTGPNPNPGERSSDVFWHQHKYDKAISIIKPNAEQNFPWAQLRMGVAYQLGLGVKQDFDQALLWYKKVATQKAEGGWANGKMIGAIGKSGYFNQNSDAMVAQYQIASIYLKSDKRHEDLIKAYLWANYVSKESNDQNVFYCCEFSGGRWITQDMINKVRSDILSNMTEKQKLTSEKIFKSWDPLHDTSGVIPNTKPFTGNRK